MDQIVDILTHYKNVAVVGISSNPEKDSYRVAKYLMEHGFRVIPVNPNLSSWEGLKAYPSVSAIEDKVEIVDVFRKPEAVLEVVDDALKVSPKVIWMQEGVVNEEARQLAEKHGINVVMDKCMMKEHIKLANSQR
ncbi:CoA-binding protein [Thermoplasma volcanium]|nr:CoA-binding protein [Thermoplasma volcanium]